jgi:hypothetical protein
MEKYLCTDYWSSLRLASNVSFLISFPKQNLEQYRDLKQVSSPLRFQSSGIWSREAWQTDTKL